MDRRVPAALVLALAGCAEEPGSERGEAPPEGLFTWIEAAPGPWRHRSAASSEYRLPEVVCGGVVFLDFDGDHDQDVFLVQGGVWPDLEPQAEYPGHALLRNDGGWRFTDVAREAGVQGRRDFYGMGAVAADHDNDGDADLYVTSFGPNVLYSNNGDGTFTDVTAEAGVGGGEVWSSSACWFDADGDGWLDLYVVNYLTYTHEINRRSDCGVATTGIRDYCSPRSFDGAQDFYFHNEDGRHFRERALEVGLGCPGPLASNAKGLGVVASDVDGDADLDLYVANDSTANFLFLNDGTGRFQENGLIAGCAFSEDGQGQAGMGTEAADVDADGDMDLWVVHLDIETNALYRNDGHGFFVDDYRSAGLGAPSRGQVGFGTDFFDFDHDADLDLVIANGHVLVHVDRSRGTFHYLQRDQLLENRGDGTFDLVPPERAGRYFDVENAARGLATGDLDDDGDRDVVILVRDDAPVFLRNDTGTGHGASFLLELETLQGNRDAVGARVAVRTAGRTLVEEARAGSSYCSSHDRRLHFGLGAAQEADAVQVRWPDGTLEDLGPVASGATYHVLQGKGVVATRPFRK